MLLLLDITYMQRRHLLVYLIFIFILEYPLRTENEEEQEAALALFYF